VSAPQAVFHAASIIAPSSFSRGWSQGGRKQLAAFVAHLDGFDIYYTPDPGWWFCVGPDKELRFGGTVDSIRSSSWVPNDNPPTPPSVEQFIFRVDRLNA
jgi:hypothetical protein